MAEPGPFHPSAKRNKVIKMTVKENASGMVLIPKHLDIVITHRCNARCIMCLNWTFPDEPEMPTDVVAGMVRDACRLGISSICITGGEPFVRHDIVEIVAAAQEFGSVDFTIATNGNLVTPCLLSELKRAGLRNLNLPIDSIDPDENDAVRGMTGSLAKVMDVLDLARKMGFHTTSTTMVSKMNFRKLSQILRLAQGLGVCFVNFQPFDPFMVDYEKEKTGRLWISGEQDLKVLKSEVQEVISYCRKNKIRTNSADYLLAIPDCFANGVKNAACRN